jgi:hypothetical protein
MIHSMAEQKLAVKIPRAAAPHAVALVVHHFT